MVRVFTTVALACLAAVASAETLPNWVGPKVGNPIDTACYRKTLRNSVCPLGYDSDSLGGCWAQCPLEYPVACGMECIPQSMDCTLEVITKVGAVATVAINLATSSLFSSLVSSSVASGLKCGGSLFPIVTKIVVVAGELQSASPDLTDAALVTLLLQQSVVTSDLTKAVISCAGLPSLAGTAVSAIVEFIVKQVASKGSAVLVPDTFVQLTQSAGIGASLTALSASDLAFFKQLIANGPSCGMELKSVLDQVVQYVLTLKSVNAKITPEQIKVELAKTALFLTQVPAVTTHCAAMISNNSTSSSTSITTGTSIYDLRDMIRKALQSFIDKVVEGAYQNGNPVPPEYYALVAIDLGLDALSSVDSMGIVTLVQTFLEPICGPTSMMGEIDNGPAALALGLHAQGAAFNGSYGQWTQAGDGRVKIQFQSQDTQDVTVNVWSGGSQIASVAVPKGQRVDWTKNITDLQDKTLYLDRWRPGFLGLPGTGGGSLLAWVPRAAKGGHFELTALLSVS